MNDLNKSIEEAYFGILDVDKKEYCFVGFDNALIYGLDEEEKKILSFFKEKCNLEKDDFLFSEGFQHGSKCSMKNIYEMLFTMHADCSNFILFANIQNILESKKAEEFLLNHIVY